MIVDTIDGMINGFKCRYLFLDKLFNGKLDITKPKRLIDTVNVFISLESVYNSYRNTTIEKHLRKMERKEIRRVYRQLISNTVNIVAHYRKYFARHGVKTNFVFFFNEITDTFIDYNNSAMCPDYREHFFESIHDVERININSLVEESIPFMRIIVEYIENVYLVGARHLESSVIPFTFMMENYLPANMNIIVTKDVYDFQYCNYNCLVITRSQNEPVLVTRKNVMKYMAWKEEMKMERTIHPKLLPFILSCLGDKKRSIPKVVHGFGFKKIVKELYKLYDEGYIYDDDTDTMNMQNLMHVLNKDEYRIMSESTIASDLMSNFHVIDLETQYKSMNKSQKKALTDQLIDKTDAGAIIEMNERYFEHCPLQAAELNQARRVDNMKFRE